MNAIAGDSHRSRGFWFVVSGVVASVGLIWTAAQGSGISEQLIHEQSGSQVSLAPGNLASSSKCVECHQFESTQTHPVNVYASTSSASKVQQSGIMTCLTCHDASASHASSAEKVGVRGGNSASLCVQCHTPGADSRSSHALVYGKAHIKSDNSKAMSLQGGIDLESQDCMSCHDGTAAGGAVSHSMQLSESQALSEHPIGVPLRTSERTRNGDFRMADPNSLDRRLRLPGGNLSCVSCHSVYSNEPAKLVMSNQGSKLCLSCHK